MNDKEKMESIGALWEKNSPKGAKYFAGSVEIDGKKIPLVVFKNGYKKEDKHPDWKIFISKPKEERNNEVNENTENTEQQIDDDLPF